METIVESMLSLNERPKPASRQALPRSSPLHHPPRPRPRPSPEGPEPPVGQVEVSIESSPASAPSRRRASGTFIILLGKRCGHCHTFVNGGHLAPMVLSINRYSSDDQLCQVRFAEDIKFDPVARSRLLTPSLLWLAPEYQDDIIKNDLSNCKFEIFTPIYGTSSKLSAIFDWVSAKITLNEFV